MHTFFSLPCPLGNASVRAAILAKVFGEGNHRNRVQRQPPDRYFAQGGKNESKKKTTEVDVAADRSHRTRRRISSRAWGPTSKARMIWRRANCSLLARLSMGGGQAYVSPRLRESAAARRYSSNQPCNSASAVCHRGCGFALHLHAGGVPKRSCRMPSDCWPVWQLVFPDCYNLGTSGPTRFPLLVTTHDDSVICIYSLSTYKISF